MPSVVPSIRPGVELGAGRYHIIEQLGEGAFGRVFRAHDRQFATDVALKALMTLAPSNLLALKNEFRSIASISHPNLVRYHDLSGDAEPYFFTMDLIDGSDLRTWCWQGTEFPGQSEALRARIADSFAQLALAIGALHDHDQLHRDIKPGNVMVTTEGRVVLLDFGLSYRSLSGDSATRGAGTPGYWAPEQISGMPKTASDWYSFGVTLFQVSSGEQLPVDFYLANTAQRADILSAAPEYLRHALARYLDVDPEDRADENVFLSLVGYKPRDFSETSPTPTGKLVGRRKELAALAETLESHRGRPLVVRVTGESGIGKTETVRALLRDLDTHSTLVLSGRCRPNEHVHYRAVDPMIDDLVRELGTMPTQEVERLVPSPSLLGPLVQQFPVMLAVPAFAEAASGVSPDPASPESRRLAHRGLCGLLSGISAMKQLIFWIDDAHWGDADSLVLLRDFFESLPLHLIASSRGHSREGETFFLDGVDQIQRDLDLAEFALLLEPLNATDARDLATSLFAYDSRPTDPDIERLLDETRGSPFLISEVTRTIKQLGRIDTGASLESTLALRLSRLDDTVAALVKLVAVANRPVPLREVSALANVPSVAINNLADLCWIRVFEQDGDVYLDSYHDRIRETTVELIEPVQLESLHRDCVSLIDAMPEVDPDWLLEQLMGARDFTRAVDTALIAAEQALRRFAFEHAAQDFAVAIDLLGENATAAHYERQAEALRLACKNKEAAAALETASQLATSTAERLRLRFDIAAEYLKSAQIRAAMSAMDQLLPEFGLQTRYPGMPLEKVSRRYRHRAILKSRLFGLRAGLGNSVRAGLDLKAIIALGEFIDPMDRLHGDLIGVQGFVSALHACDKPALRRVLSHEATKEASRGGWLRRHSKRVLLESLRLARELNLDGYDRAHALWCIATCYWCEGNWPQAVRWWEWSERILRRLPGGVAWELTYLDMFLASPLFYLGRLEELAARVASGVQQAHDRGDLWSWTIYDTAVAPLSLLAEDKPEEALARARQAVERLGDQGVFSQHMFQLITSVRANLYQGDVEAAWAVVSQFEASMRELGVDTRMIEWRFEAVKAASAYAQHPGRTALTIRELVDVILHEASALARDPVSSSVGLSAFALAAAASIQGHDSAVTQHLETARDGFKRASMPMFQKLAEAHLLEHRAAAKSWISGHGVANVSRFIAAMSPVIAHPVA